MLDLLLQCFGSALGLIMGKLGKSLDVEAQDWAALVVRPERFAQKYGVWLCGTVLGITLVSMAQ